MYIDLHVTYKLLSDVNLTRIFSTYFRIIIDISWKSIQWEPSCSIWTKRQTDRQTDMTELIVAFRNFANAPKTLNYCHCYTAQTVEYTWICLICSIKCTSHWLSNRQDYAPPHYHVKANKSWSICVGYITVLIDSLYVIT